AHLPFDEQPVWTLTGQVRSDPMGVSMETIDFGTDFPQSRASRAKSFEVVLPQSGTLVELHAASLMPDLVTVQVRNDGLGTYTAKVFPPTATGPFSTEIELTALDESGKAGPVRRLPVRGRICADVEAVPNPFSLPAVPVGEMASGTVSLVSYIGEPFEIVSIDAEGIEVEETEVEETIDRSSNRLSRSFRIRRYIGETGNHQEAVVFFIRLAGRSSEERRIVLPVSTYGINGASSGTAEASVQVPLAPMTQE
ncbi:MAG: hypothetical protein M3552_01995, partial [Planctomycetota bacterium]|nr:hypothetical protein [Planctomycetota bacterium]